MVTVDPRRKNLYNLTDSEGNYVMLDTLRELCIPSRHHGLFMGCVHLCDGNIKYAHSTYQGILNGDISIDAVIDVLINVYVSGTGVAIYECYESIVSSRYTIHRESLRKDIRDSLVESVACDAVKIRTNNDPVQVLTVTLPKK